MNRIAVRIAVMGLALLLAACAQAPPAPQGGVLDPPNEAGNRRTFAFNQKLDRAVLSPPASTAYGEGLPTGVRRGGVSNFSNNASLPGDVVNKLLQGELEDAVHNAIRFGFNSTFGLLGLFDVATDIGLEERGTDFGETLHRWGGFARGGVMWCCRSLAPPQLSVMRRGGSRLTSC